MRSPRLLAFVLTFAAVLRAGVAEGGDEPPRIVRLRVPSDRVKTLFPPGTELRVMPRDEFETLARSAIRTSGEKTAPALLRAKHEARLDGERLIGRSELSWSGSSEANAVVALDPWTPAIDGTGPGADLVRAGPGGRLGLSAADASTRTVSLAWEQRSRSGTSGRAFDLGLPATAACRLTLDLPEGLVPEVPGTIRQGPEMGPSTDRRTWRIDGRGGAWPLRLHAAGADGEPIPRVWFSGVTRVDASDRPARWTLDASVDPGPSGARRFGIELDPGLDLIDVSGPGVASYRAEPLPAGGTSLTVRLADSASGASDVRVRALCRDLPEGPWQIPSYRLRGAVWTGGRTVVRLGAGVVVSGVRPMGGEQVATAAAEREFGHSRAGLVLAFEAARPGPPAEIVLKRSPIHASAEVRGQIVLGPFDAPRLEARVIWRVDQGRIPSLSVDLPAGWVPEKAQIQGVAEPTPWHAEGRPGGGSRVVVHTPASGEPGGAVALDLTAAASPGDRPEGLELPRITPMGARLVDEVWTLRTDSGVTVTPLQARGLTWLDPAEVDPLKPLVARLFATKPVLSWRWTAGDGQATVAVRSSASIAAVETWTSATVSGDRLTMEYSLLVDTRDRPPIDLNVAFLGDEGPAPVRWEHAAEPGREIVAMPIPPGDRERLNLPRGGSACRIVVPRSGRDRLVLRARVDRRWTGSGTLPLMVPLDGKLARGTILVFADRSLATRINAPGLPSRDPKWAASAYLQIAGLEGDVDRPRMRPAQAFGYGANSSPPTIETESLRPASLGGLVEEARLTSRPAPEGRTLHRLALRVVPGRDRQIEVDLPRNADPARVEIEGREAFPNRVSGRLRVALPAATPIRPFVEIEIDYLSAKANDVLSIQPDLPRFSLPCLAFSWGLDLPLDRTIDAVSPGLVLAGTGSGTLPKSTDADLAVMTVLDERCRLFPAEGTSLASWLVRLDGGRVPIVIDRLALERAGWGPRTPLPSRQDRSRVSTASEAFASLGLSIEPRAGVAVVGSSTRATDISGDAVARAATAGHDQADRLQSVSRWQGESTPNLFAGRTRRSDETQGARFAASGWPAAGVGVRLVDPASRTIASFVVAASIALGAAATRRRSLRFRALALALIFGLGSSWSSIAPAAATDVGPALIWGGCIAVGIGLGALLRSSHRQDRPGPTQSRHSRVRTAGMVGMVLFAALSQAPARQAPDAIPATTVDTGTVYAILPFDPPFDPSEPAPRVVLKLSDHDRLRARADDLTKPPPGEPLLTGALHEVRREGSRDVRVTSTYSLRSDAPGSAAWAMPIGGSRDVSATLDGRDAPVRVGRNATLGTIDLEGQGEHRLVVRRLVGLVSTAGGDAIRLPVAPIATARIRVDEPPGETAAEAPSSRGLCLSQNGIFEGLLGPVPELELRWLGRARVGPPEPQGEADGMILWDVEPAGDRVRLRITTRSGEPLDRLALALAPGVSVRSADRPGAADATQRVAADGTVWRMPLSPPLAAGQSLTIELWRPLEEGREDPSRALPGIKILGLSEFTCLVGVRRPEAWTGRVGAADGGELVPDDLFARSWGPFPDGIATFAGASRLAGAAELVLRAGPARERPRLSPSASLQLAAGRLDVRAEAELVDDGGRARELEAIIPPDLRLARVEATGLTDWSRPADDRLRLRFDDDLAPARRTIRIVGWVPIDTDPMAIEAARSAADVPWPAWIGAEVLPGDLEIISPSNVSVRLEAPPGVRPKVPATVATGVARLEFSVPPAVAPGLLRWTVEAPGVTVRVQSLMTLHPATADWVASARYSLAWGPCPPIKLRLPAAWADGATAEIDGVAVVPQIETQAGTVTWTLRPGRPAWGGARVTIRASRPRPMTGSLAFPDLVPLGRPQLDRADSYLAYADASGTATIVDRSAELQPVEASRWDADHVSWPPGPARNVLRVLKEGWSLRFLSPPPARNAADGTGVALADLECTLNADGELLGHACYELDGRPARNLILTLPKSAETLAATVDGAAVVPRLDRANRVLIPLPDEAAGRVVLCWRDAVDASRGGLISLPTLPGQSVPTTLSMSAPDRSRFARSGKTAAITEGERYERGLDVRSRLLAERLGTFDRESSRDRSALISALIRIELHARAVLRASSPAHLDPAASGRHVLEQALANAKLEDFARSAAARVGRSEADPLPSQPAAFEPPASLRVRPIGATFVFRDDEGSPAVRWSLSPSVQNPLKPWWPTAASVGLALLACAFGPGRPRSSWTALVLAAGIAVMASGLGGTSVLLRPASLVAGAIRG